MCGAQQGGCLPIIHSTLGTTLKQCGGTCPETQHAGDGFRRIKVSLSYMGSLEPAWAIGDSVS